MKEMTIEDIKSCSLGLLCFFDKVCRDNGIHYFLCGGTLLGAIRHKGFIPWDDDIDVMMPRVDYERLFQVWPEDSPYSLLCHKNTISFPYAYGKAIDSRTVKIEPIRNSCQHLGVDIDVFPIDNIPDSDDETTAFFKQIAVYQNRLSRQILRFERSYGSIKTILRNCYVVLSRVIEMLIGDSVDKTIARFSCFAQQYNDQQTKYCGITSISHYGDKEKNPKSTYEDVVYVSFEGKEYPAPIGYKYYLERLYGSNYLQLPPKEMRITHHGYKAYWK